LASGPHGSLEHVKLLVERGADIHLKDRLGNNALNASLSADNPDIAKYLIQLGADVNNINYNGVTVARQVELTLDRANPNTEFYHEFKELYDMLAERGVKFPHQHPKIVRAWMRSQGMYVIGDD
ncbi:MAG: hypothetical protein GXX06_11910, partial [Gammaproteobacteria bacterium]|nr:hypothetical protein [Gammaproteobacteria bacterium]